MQVESGSQKSAHRSNISRDIRHIHLGAGWNRSLVGLAMKLHIDNFRGMCLFSDPECPTDLPFLCHLSRGLSKSPRCKLYSANHCRSSISLCHCSADSNLDSSLRLHTSDRYLPHRTILSRNPPNCANTSRLASHPSSRSPSRTTIHQASLPQRPQLPLTNKQLRQEKKSLLGHDAIQRIQGQQQQTVKDASPLHRVPSDDAPAIEGIGPSYGHISTVSTERFCPLLILLLIPPISLSIPAAALSLALLSTFLLAFFPYFYLFLSPFLSLSNRET